MRSKGADVRAITFDFHNTLVACDPWFDLEVKHLPGAVLHRLAGTGEITLPGGAVESAEQHYRALRKAVISSGEELDASACVAAVVGELGLDIGQARLDATIDDLMRGTLAHASLVPGAWETVHELRDFGYPLGIVSSAVYHPFLEWALDRFDLAGAFTVVTTSASCGFYKSRREIYDLTLDELGASAAASVHVGDSLRFDVGGAQQAGMKTVWLRRADHHPHAGGDVSYAPDLTIESLIDAAPAIVALLDGEPALSARP